MTTIPRSTLRAILVASLALAPWALSISQAAAQSDVSGVEGRRALHEPHGRRRRHRRRQGTRKLLDELDLTDAQRAQIRAIRQSTREQLRELHGRSPQTRAAKRALRRQARRRMREVLTPAQQSRLDELRAERRARRLDRRVSRMREHLGLSGTQAAQIRQILERAATQRRVLRAADMTPEEQHRQRLVLREQTREAIDAVLTPAQRRLAAEHRERGPRRRGRRGLGRPHGGGR